MRKRLEALSLAVIVALGCSGSSPVGDQLRCALLDASSCPIGFSCDQSDGICKQIEAGASDDAGIDAGGADATADAGIDGGADGGADAAVDPVLVTVVDPPRGPTAGGIAATIGGSGFAPGTTVMFGGVAATVVYRSEDGKQLSVVTPSGAPFDTVGVSATNANGSATLQDAFTFIPEINTVAGGGSGSGQPATSVPLTQPFFMAVGPDNLVYIATFGGHRVFRIEQSGTLTLIAGTGEPRSEPDGPAIATSIWFAGALAFNAQGVLHMADFYGSRVRKVVAGQMVTVAGNGSCTVSGDNGPATVAGLCNPSGIAFDSVGRLLITQWDHHRVRRVDQNGIITTVAGTGLPGFSPDASSALEANIAYPRSIVEFPAGSNGFVFTEYPNSIVRHVSGDGGTSILIGGGSSSFSDGMAARAFNGYAPVCLARTGSGDLVLSTWAISWILRYDRVGGTLSRIAGVGAQSSAADGVVAASSPVGYPCAVAGGAGAYTFSEFIYGKVRAISADGGTLSTVAGTDGTPSFGDNGPATEAALFGPRAVLVEPDGGGFFVADTMNHRIRRVDADGGIRTIAGSGTAGYGEGAPLAAIFNSPSGLARDVAGNLVVSDTGNHRLRRVSADGTAVSLVAGNGTPGFSGEGGSATAAALNGPRGVAVAANGDIVFCDTENHVVRTVVADGGAIFTLAGIPGVTSLDGGVGDGLLANQAALFSPSGVAFDRAGNLLIADTGHHRVRRVRADGGAIETMAGTGVANSDGDFGAAASASLSLPSGVCVDTRDRVFVAETGSHVVRRIARNDAGVEIALTVAGFTFHRGYFGEGVAATAAYLDNPVGVGCAADGALLVVDSANNRVRRIR